MNNQTKEMVKDIGGQKVLPAFTGPKTGPDRISSIYSAILSPYTLGNSFEWPRPSSCP